MPETQADAVLDLVRHKGILRSRELQEAELPRSLLGRMVKERRLVRLGRGLYSLPEGELTEHHSLAEASKRIPKGIICLLSALRFHELTTEAPFEVWICLDRHAPTPRLEYPPLRVVRASTAARNFAVEHHPIEGVAVPISSPAKTVVDCFKYRNKIGVSVAVAALTDYLRERRGSLDELWQAARVCRMTRVMTPYLEALSR